MRPPTGLISCLLAFLFSLLTLSAGEPTETDIALPETGDPIEGTRILSDRLDIFTAEEPVRLLFSGNVRVISGPFVLHCEELEILRAAESASNEAGEIDRITARGEIRLIQGNRTLTAGEAVMLPAEGTITLTGQPTLKDQQGEVRGERIILEQFTGRAIVEGSADQPARVDLPLLNAPTPRSE